MQGLHAGICHEINNPLAVISLVLGSLKRHLGREEGKESKELLRSLDKVEDCSNRIGRIVNGLRTYARSNERSDYEEIKVAEALEGTLLLCQERLNHAGIKFSSSIEDNLSIYGNQAQIIQIFFNLLSNSYDAIKDLPNKWIKFTAEKNDTEDIVTIRISDSGPGIGATIAEKIMMPFYSTKEIGSGTGLGLSICQGLCNEMGGSIDYELYSGNTSFLIKLPA